VRGLGRLLTLPLVFALVGCNSSGTSPQATGKVDYKTVRTMADLYAAYLGSNGDQPPPDEQAFRQFLQTKQSNLERAGLTIEQMFVSPRNGEPLEWVYRGPLPTTDNGMTVFAYEKSSADGKRLVIARRGMYQVMDQAEFDRAIARAN